MNKSTIVVIAVLAFLGIFGLATMGWGVSTYNGFVASENSIVASYKQDQNVDSEILNTIRSQGSVGKEYESAVLNAIDKSIKGRYGNDGAKQAILFLKEDNPKMDPAVFLKISEAIEAGYAKFSASQATRVDKVRSYQTSTQTFPASIVAKVCGFPRIDLEKYGKVVISGETQKNFDTGTQNAVDPFAK